MPIQAYVDDSGGKGQPGHLVLASLIASSESWASFSDEWEECLKTPPVIRYFKMKEAAGRNTQFSGFTEQQRDDKLRALACIINRHVSIATYAAINLEAHAQTWAVTNEKPLSEPYFFPYHTTVLAGAHELWDRGLRERFEIIFDEHVIFAPRVKIWYPLIKQFVEFQHPEVYPILPVDQLFRTDDEFLPIQAADLFAWCWRNSVAPQGRAGAFDWLWAAMPDIRISKYSHLYDLERLQSVTKESVRMVEDGELAKFMEEFGPKTEGDDSAL